MGNIKKLGKIVIDSQGRENGMLRIAILSLLYGTATTAVGVAGIFMGQLFALEIWIGLPLLALGVTLTILYRKRRRIERSELPDSADRRERVLSAQHNGSE